MEWRIRNEATQYLEVEFNLVSSSETDRKRQEQSRKQSAMSDPNKRRPKEEKGGEKQFSFALGTFLSIHWVLH